MVWRMKYYQMLFPTLFAPFYGQDIQLRVLHFLNQKPSDIPFIRMGQISLYARKCNVPGVVFAHIYGKNVGYTNDTDDSDTNTLSDKKHKTHYWMYTVFDDKSWNECQQKGIMVLGMIQFHQSYSYEDFIEGYRPTENGFTIKKGSFYKFCKLAEEDDENDYFFIIDEINRGNLSKIFGELFMLIEKDKRGIELQLLYSDENFSVPANVYIIGKLENQVH